MAPRPTHGYLLHLDGVVDEPQLLRGAPEVPLGEPRLEAERGHFQRHRTRRAECAGAVSFVPKIPTASLRHARPAAHALISMHVRSFVSLVY